MTVLRKVLFDGITLPAFLKSISFWLINFVSANKDQRWQGFQSRLSDFVLIFLFGKFQFLD